MANTQAYFDAAKITTVKSFTVQAPDVAVDRPISRPACLQIDQGHVL